MSTSTTSYACVFVPSFSCGGHCPRGATLRALRALVLLAGFYLLCVFLAFYLSLQDRDEMAIEQFKLVDGYVSALPWRYRGDGMAAYYCRIRNSSAQAVTSGTG